MLVIGERLQDRRVELPQLGAELVVGLAAVPDSWKQYRAVASRYDKRDYIFNGTLAVTAIVIWLRDIIQEPSETT
ncbi:hypothetical protein ACH41H_44345 [Streptomyces sp. NPDC020800]|uniref:hypothetical protein n=1 Tax=Streptomyces sp. NPDC020800 TaxID=3365092 RepID=UPI0037B6A9FC